MSRERSQTSQQRISTLPKPWGKRKQRLLREAERMFKELDNIAKPERQVEKKKVKSKIYKGQVKSFFEQMDTGFGQPAGKLKQRGVQWPELFHYRMQVFRDVLGDSRAKKYEQLVRFYQKQLGDGGQQKGAAFDACTGFLTFLSTHRVDPDSSLVGFSPHPDVLARYSLFIEHGSHLLPPGVDLDKETSRDSLIATIQAWSQLDSSDTIFKELKRMLSLLNAAPNVNQMPKQGDIVIYLSPTNGPVYARVSGRRENDKIGVYLTPEERSEEMVTASKLLALTVELAASSELTQLRGLVQNPISDLHRKLGKQIKQLTLQYLSSKGFDLLLAADARADRTTLRQLARVKTNQAVLTEFQSQPPEAFLASIIDLGRKQVAQFVASVGPYDLFYPTRDEELYALDNTLWAERPVQCLRRIISDHKRALAALQLQIKEILDGTTKNRITQWWLVFIKAECEKFLAMRGYAFDAVPVDYIEQPPPDFQAVRDNFALIKDIINPTEEKHQVQQMVQRIKDTVYPEIDRFIANAQLVLAEALNIDATAFSLDEAEVRLQADKDRYPEETHRCINDILQDIRYLNRMKELENTKEKVLDIVPVTGLVVGRFYRLENELRTVLEHWADAEPEVEDPSDNSISSSKDLRGSSQLCQSAPAVGRSNSPPSSNHSPLSVSTSSVEPATPVQPSSGWVTPLRGRGTSMTDAVLRNSNLRTSGNVPGTSPSSSPPTTSLNATELSSARAQKAKVRAET